MTDSVGTPTGTEEHVERTRDGRRRWSEPCAYGHTIRAMECPSCGEKLGWAASPAAIQWYERRYPKRAKYRRALAAALTNQQEERTP